MGLVCLQSVNVWFEGLAWQHMFFFYKHLENPFLSPLLLNLSYQYCYEVYFYDNLFSLQKKVCFSRQTLWQEIELAIMLIVVIDIFLVVDMGIHPRRKLFVAA